MCLRSTGRRLRSPSLLWTGARRADHASPPGPAPGRACPPARKGAGFHGPEWQRRSPGRWHLRTRRQAHRKRETGQPPRVGTRTSTEGTGSDGPVRQGPARRAGGLLKTAEYLKEATPLRLPVRAHTESSTEPVRHFRCPCKTASRACQPKRLPQRLRAENAAWDFYLTTSSLATCIRHSVSDSELCIERLCAVVGHTSR